MERDFIKWFKNTGLGFVMKIPKEVEPSLMYYLENTNKIGVYVFHSYIKVGDKMQFDSMQLGYYVRSKNPFKWNFRSTAGNH